MEKVTSSTSLLWHTHELPDQPGNYLVRYDLTARDMGHGHKQTSSRTGNRDWDGQQWLGSGPTPSAWRPHFVAAGRKLEPERSEDYVPKAPPSEEVRAKISASLKERNQAKKQPKPAGTRKSDKGHTPPEVRARISAAVKAANERRKAEQAKKEQQP